MARLSLALRPALGPETLDRRPPLLSRPMLARLAWPLALAAACALAGCGRSMPVAPDASASREVPHPSYAYPDRDLVVVWIAPGVDLAGLAKSYGAKVVEPESWSCAGLMSMVGDSPEKLAAKLTQDAPRHGWDNP